MGSAATVTGEETRARRGLGVVVNPHSRRNRRRPGISERLERVAGQDAVVRVSSDRSRLHAIAESFRSQRIDVLALCGGDGTVGYSLTAFQEVYGDEALPRIAILRGGTMNTIANSLGLPRHGAVSQLRRLVERVASGSKLESAERFAMRLGQGSSPRLGFLLGTGLTSGFLEEYYAYGPDPTVLTAARVLGTIAWSAAVRGPLARRLAAPSRIAIRADGETWPQRSYIAVMAGTVDQVGLGFRPFYPVGATPGSLRLIGVHAPASKVARRLYRAWFGRSLGADCTQEAFVAKAVLTPATGRLRYFLDGDLHDAEGELCIEVGPRIRFVW